MRNTQGRAHRSARGTTLLGHAASSEAGAGPAAEQKIPSLHNRRDEIESFSLAVPPCLDALRASRSDPLTGVSSGSVLRPWNSLSAPAPRALPLSAAARKPFQPRSFLSVRARINAASGFRFIAFACIMEYFRHIIIRNSILSRANLEIISPDGRNANHQSKCITPTAQSLHLI